MFSFKQYIQLDERVLSIGFNPKHAKYREQHRQELHDILYHSYKDIGGYGGLGSGSPEEHAAIHSDISQYNIKAVRRAGKITAANLYRDQHGRKSVASGTNGTDQGRQDFKKIKTEDHTQKRAWGEVSGKVEHVLKKIGMPVIPTDKVSGLIGKPIVAHPDGQHYDRVIGNHMHTKIALGHPKI